jgi:ketosteroid isomerase-like protein
MAKAERVVRETFAALDARDIDRFRTLVRPSARTASSPSRYRNSIYYDGAAFARQIGMLPALGSPVDRTLMFNLRTRFRRSRRPRSRVAA